MATSCSLHLHYLLAVHGMQVRSADAHMCIRCSANMIDEAIIGNKFWSCSR